MSASESIFFRAVSFDVDQVQASPNLAYNGAFDLDYLRRLRWGGCFGCLLVRVKEIIK